MKTVLNNNKGIYTIILNKEEHSISQNNVSNLLFELSIDDHLSFLKSGKIEIDRDIYHIEDKFVYENSIEFKQKYN